MPAFTEEDFFAVDNLDWSRALRDRLGQVARDVIDAVRPRAMHPDLFRAHYATKHPKRSHQWVAILSDPARRESLSRKPHLHIIVGQEGTKHVWFGINTEFKNPRRMLEDAMNPTKEWRADLRSAWSRCEDAEAYVYVKRVNKSQHTDYEWVRAWDGWRPTALSSMNDEAFEKLREILLIPPVDDTDPNYRLEPAIIMGWDWTMEEAIAAGVGSWRQSPSRRSCSSPL